MRRLLADRDARWLLGGQALSMFGDRAMFLVLAIWVKALTRSSAAAGMVVFVSVAPALAAPLAGVLVDRLRRRPVMIVTDLAIGLAVLALLFVRGPSQVWLIYMVAALYGSATTVFDCAQSALLTVMLPADLLPDANGAFQTVREGLRLISPLAGAGLYVAFGGGSVAAIDATTFAVSALCLWRLRVAEPAAERAEHRFLTEVAAGVKHVLRAGTLRRIVLTTAAALLVVGFSETIIFTVVDQALHRPPSFVGVLGFAQGVGAVAGGLTAARAIRRLGDARVVGVGIGLFAVGDGMMITGSLRAIAPGIVLSGLGIAWVVVGFFTALQTRTPPHLQGRAFSAADTMTGIPQTISIAVGAALSLVLDYRLLIAIMASVTLACGVALVLRGAKTPTVTDPAEPLPAPLVA